MSELEDADAAIEERQLNIARVIDPGHPHMDPYRLLFMGMDLDADEVWERAQTGARVALAEIAAEIKRAEDEDELPEIGLHDFFTSIWLDGFSVAAMLFLRRSEVAPSEDVGSGPWTCPECKSPNPSHAILCHSCGWDSAR